MHDLNTLIFFGSLISSSVLGKAAATLNSSSAEATLMWRHLSRMIIEQHIKKGTSCTCLRYQTSLKLHLAQYQFHRSPWAREPCQQARGKPAFRTFRINWRLHFRRQTIAFQTHLIGQDGLDDALLATLDPPHFLSPLIHLLRLQFQLGLRKSKSICVWR